MKAASVNEIKNELKQLQQQQLLQLCLELARYKKDNKEFLGYLLFESHDKRVFITELQKEISIQFSEIDPTQNLYYCKKGLRKILRQIVKYCRYLDDKALAAELHMYFCKQLKNSKIPFKKSQLLINMYEQELKKIRVLIASLHEDLQGDYEQELQELTI